MFVGAQVGAGSLFEVSAGVTDCPAALVRAQAQFVPAAAPARLRRAAALKTVPAAAPVRLQSAAALKIGPVVDRSIERKAIAASTVLRARASRAALQQ